MIVFRTPKGWTGPHEIDGVLVEGTWRSHQVPFADVRGRADRLEELERWLRSYRPEELFDEHGALAAELASLPPQGKRRMSGNPKTNGGLLLRDLVLPDFRDYAVEVDKPGTTSSEATRVLGAWLRDVVARNPQNFRIFGPDETASNRLGDVLEVTDKQWDALLEPTDEHLAPSGRVMEMLSEHQCQGWLEGYLLTGRHGLFNCYEAFIHIVDSMVNQHAKWLKVTRSIPWRRPLASLNYLLSSHVWRQDHNGFSHQDPGFIDHVVNKKAEIIRVYLPPDANCLLSVGDHALRSRHYVNVIVAGKQPALNYLPVDDAVVHCTRGIGIWGWASNDAGGEPDVVLGCCGDIPTLETLAATALLREHIPDLKVRVVNVVDLMRLQPASEHPHGLSDVEFDALFTVDKPVIFAYHGYPWLIHRLTYRRNGHGNLHVRGYKEEGTTTTPFDMVMLNDLDRFHLVIDVIDRVPGLGGRAARLRQDMVDRRLRARMYTREQGEDEPEIRDWIWPH
jgi:xylulose-5-phosphate/fructose-6-phosphate phosphoketolase